MGMLDQLLGVAGGVGNMIVPGLGSAINMGKGLLSDTAKKDQTFQAGLNTMMPGAGAMTSLMKQQAGGMTDQQGLGSALNTGNNSDPEADAVEGGSGNMIGGLLGAGQSVLGGLMGGMDKEYNKEQGVKNAELVHQRAINQTDNLNNQAVRRNQMAGLQTAQDQAGRYAAMGAGGRASGGDMVNTNANAAMKGAMVGQAMSPMAQQMSEVEGQYGQNEMQKANLLGDQASRYGTTADKAAISYFDKNNPYAHMMSGFKGGWDMVNGLVNEKAFKVT